MIITPHQGFYTREALTAIAESTISSITEYARYVRLLSFSNSGLVGSFLVHAWLLFD